MRAIARSIAVAVLVLVSAVVLGITSSLTLAVTLAATRALIVPGTGTPDPAPVPNYMPNAVNYYLVPAGDCVGGCTAVPVPYLAQFWPIPLPGWGGLQGAKWNVSVQSGVDKLLVTYIVEKASGDNITIFGYSQGATVASIVKGNLRDLPQADKDKLDFFFIGNPQRPNGGFFVRPAVLGNFTVPVLDATFGNPAPTDTCEHSNGDPCAVDFALMYDGVVDFPVWPINLLAVANAAAGFQYVHGTYLAPKGTDPATATPYGYTADEVQAAVAAATAPGGCTAANHCQRHGDTLYITLPARTLPIMQPALDFAAATGTSALVIPIVDLISPATQTLIETGYDRTDYGEPTPFRLLPRINPVTLTTDLINDIPEGINAALDPGLTPLPGSVPTPVTTADTTLVDAKAPDATTAAGATTPTVLPDRKPLTRLSMIARPGEGLEVPETTATKPEQPTVRNSLGANAHPVHDVTRSLAGAVRTALGGDDDTGTAGDNTSNNAPSTPAA